MKKKSLLDLSSIHSTLQLKKIDIQREGLEQQCSGNVKTRRCWKESETFGLQHMEQCVYMYKIDMDRLNRLHIYQI